jgi:hypothetical protein
MRAVGVVMRGVLGENGFEMVRPEFSDLFANAQVNGARDEGASTARREMP